MVLMTIDQDSCRFCQHGLFKTTLGCDCNCHATWQEMLMVCNGDEEKTKTMAIEMASRIDNKLDPNTKQDLMDIAVRTIHKEEMTPEELERVKKAFDRIGGRELKF